MSDSEDEAEVDWPTLVRLALAGQPERLVGLVTAPEINVPGFIWRRPIFPPDVLAVIEELRRVRNGRPAKSDRYCAAAKEWQRQEAKRRYAWALQGYQLAKDADATLSAVEVRQGRSSLIQFNVRARAPIVRGGGLSPKELAIEDVAETMGRSPEAVRRMIFGRSRR